MEPSITNKTETKVWKNRKIDVTVCTDVLSKDFYLQEPWEHCYPTRW